LSRRLLAIIGFMFGALSGWVGILGAVIAHIRSGCHWLIRFWFFGLCFFGFWVFGFWLTAFVVTVLIFSMMAGWLSMRISPLVEMEGANRFAA